MKKDRKREHGVIPTGVQEGSDEGLRKAFMEGKAGEAQMQRDSGDEISRAS